MVARAPIRVTTEPLGIPKIAIGRTSAARTTLIRPGDPPVERMNQGSATKVIAVPMLETASAARSAMRVRERGMPVNIVRPYVFVKWSHAEGHRGPPRGPAAPDP